MNFDDIVVKESPGICRCCLSEGCYKDLGTEYTWMNETEVYADMLLDCFDIGITQHNEGPNGSKRLICEVCITRLRDACNFKKQVLDSEKRFIDMLGRGDFRPKVLMYQPQSRLKEESLEESAEDVLNADIEYLEDMDFGADDEEIKTEAHVSLPSTSEASHSRPKRGRPKKEEDRPEKVKKQKVAKDETSALCATAAKRRTNLKVLLNNTTIIPFKWESKYACCYCDEMYTEYTQFRKHTLSHGPCTRKILKRVDIKEIMLDVSEIVCEICQFEYKKRDCIVEHLIKTHAKEYDRNFGIKIQEYNLRELICVICSNKFNNFEVLANHVLDHAKDSFQCDYCCSWFTSATEITVHIKTHHVSFPFSCMSCSKRFKNKANLTAHVIRAHSFECKQCNAKFKLEKVFKKHIAREHSRAEFKCEYCPKILSSAMAVMVHSNKCKDRVKKENNDKEPSKPNRNTHCHAIRRNIQCVLNMSTAVPFKFKAKFVCFYCSQWFPNFDGLISHTRIQHPICDLNSKAMKTCKGERTSVKVDVNDLACKICKQPMSDLNSFVDHAIANHGAVYDKTVSFKECFEPYRITKDNLQCPECLKTFLYFATLLKHMGAEHNNHKTVCAYCGRSFRTSTSLAMHITNSHTGECYCSICNTKCNNSASLARHMARFHDAKDFKCPQCPETFETMYKKQNHLIKAHNVGHKCAHCEKMFTRNSFMLNHVRRTHLKERTVPCSVCNVKFFDVHHMKMHMVKHEGVRRFRCDLCGKSFLRARNLKSHMDTHKKGLLQQDTL